MKKHVLTSLALIAAAATFGSAPSAVQAQTALNVETVVSGLDFPWSVGFLPDGRALITERPGRLLLVDNSQVTPISGTPEVAASGQGGLLDVSVDPNFATNSLVYLSFAEPNGRRAGTAVYRAQLSGTELVNGQVIFRSNKFTRGGRHFGSRLAFDTQGWLYVTLGDRGDYMEDAQDPANTIGNIMRMRADGSQLETYSYGHRNPQGLTLRTSDGSLWSHEHGPRGGDELNKLKPGANYGWPAITYGIDYDGSIISNQSAAPGMEQPIVYWDPSIAPSGLDFYEGDLFPQWKGDAFVGALRGRELRRVDMQGDEVVGQEQLLVDLGARIRDVREGPDGAIYVLTDDSAPDGALLRLTPGR